MSLGLDLSDINTNSSSNSSPTQTEPKRGLGLDLTPSQEPSLSSYAKAVLPSMKAVGSQMLDTNQKLGRGIVRGATMGLLEKKTPEEQAMEGSIFNEQGKEKTFADKYLAPEKIGEMAGSVVPLVISEMVSGTPDSLLVSRFGLGAVKAAMAKAGLTMATYEAAKGGVENKPPLETASNMASGAMGGGVLGAIGYGAGKVGEALTKDLPKAIATDYLNTPSSISENLRRDGKTSLSEQFLERTKYGAGQSKNQVYDDISKELEQNRFVIRSKLQQADESAMVGDVGTYRTGKLGEPIRISQLQEGSGIDLDKIRNNLAPLAKEQSSIGQKSQARTIRRLMSDIAPGRSVISKSDAYDLLGQLDAEVNKNYLKATNDIAPGTEARAAFANGLRQMLSETAPEVSKLINRNHFLQSVQTSLLPQVSDTGAKFGNVKNAAVRFLLGNRFTLGAARGLRSPVVEQTTNVVSPVIKQATRLKLSETIDNMRNKGKKQ